MRGKCRLIIKNQLKKLRLSVSKGSSVSMPALIEPKGEKQFLLFSSPPDDKLIVKIKGKATGDYWIKVSNLIISESLNSDSNGIPKSLQGPSSWVVRLKSYFPEDPPEQSVTIGEDEPGKRPGKPPHKKKR